MRKAETFKRGHMEGKKGYRARKAIEIFTAHPRVQRVEIWERGLDPTVRAVPRPGTACYVMSYSAGQWTQSSEVRVHKADEVTLEERRENLRLAEGVTQAVTSKE